MRRPVQPARARQQASQEVLDGLLALIQRKFYAEDWVGFQKERRDLLRWVVLWPAAWLNERGVSLPAGRYRELVSQVLVDAAAFQRGKIKYRPAWLRQAVQSHFAHHGEMIYAEAKAARALAEHALLTLGKLPVAPTDRTVSELAAASRLLDRPKRVAKTPSPARAQLPLFDA